MRIVLVKTVWGCPEMGTPSLWDGLLRRIKASFGVLVATPHLLGRLRFSLCPPILAGLHVFCRKRDSPGSKWRSSGFPREPSSSSPSERASSFLCPLLRAKRVPREPSCL